MSELGALGVEIRPGPFVFELGRLEIPEVAKNPVDKCESRVFGPLDESGIQVDLADLDVFEEIRVKHSLVDPGQECLVEPDVRQHS